MILSLDDPSAKVDKRIGLEWLARFSELPVRVEFTDRQVQLVEVDGRLFRDAFELVVTPDKISVWLNRGATSDDLGHARRMVEEAGKGLNLSAWEVRGVGGQERLFMGLGFEHDSSTRFHYDELRPCSEVGCAVGYHSWIDGERDDSCSFEEIIGPHDLWKIGAQKEPGGAWMPYVNGDSITHTFCSVEEQTEAVEELHRRWAGLVAECERLNGVSALRRSTGPGEPDFEGRGGGL